jgi:exopolysaccharide biosynthesis polyprenyl glycosylphosphotransferase
MLVEEHIVAEEEIQNKATSRPPERVYLPMNKRLQAFKYLFSDFVAATLAWIFFFAFRKFYIEHDPDWVNNLIYNKRFYLGTVCIPICWCIIYYMQGTYDLPFRRSRLNEMAQTFFITLGGVLILFFVLLLDDEIQNYKNYYRSFAVLFTLQFTLTAVPRLMLSSITNTRIHRRKMGFNTLLIGSNENAWKTYNEIENYKKGNGNIFKGFIHIDERNGFSEKLLEKVPHLGELSDLTTMIKKHKAEEIIIALESSEHSAIQHILNDTMDLAVKVKLIPDVYDILSGSVRFTSVLHAPLIEINREVVPRWQVNAKRIFDICFSIFVIVGFSWFYLLLSLMVKLGSKGPVIFSQERLGLHGQPFKIYKFRSMYVDAERNGPALSSENDPRITPIGKFLRKTRLDEFPQFFNVFLGHMSIVGPRPERQFFVDQIVKKAPHYKHLHRVRPGITSWGQVKFGYAENVDQMIDRLKYDLLYTENMSIMVDIKIIIYTVLIVFQGRGK